MQTRRYATERVASGEENARHRFIHRRDLRYLVNAKKNLPRFPVAWPPSVKSPTVTRNPRLRQTRDAQGSSLDYHLTHFWAMRRPPYRANCTWQMSDFGTLRAPHEYMLRCAQNQCANDASLERYNPTPSSHERPATIQPSPPTYAQLFTTGMAECKQKGRTKTKRR